MSVLDLAKNIKGLAKIPKSSGDSGAKTAVIDGFIFQVHYRVTSGFLFMFSALTTTFSLVGVPKERIKKGDCSGRPCKEEAACQQYSNDSYICICPHDASLPTDDLRCPRIVVPATPSPIFNIIPPITNDTFGSSTLSPLVPTAKNSLPEFITPLVPVIFVLSGFLFLVFCLCCCCCQMCRKRRKKRKHAHKRNFGMPVVYGPGHLDDDKYTPNPGYIVAPPDLHTPNGTTIPQLSREVVKFENEIGEGCFGKVYKGKLRLDSQSEVTVAIKVLKDSATPENEDDFMREVEIMASFQHPNILSLLGFVGKDMGKSPCMVFEFMPHGDLTEVLRGNSRTLWKADPRFPRLSKESLLWIAIQIAQGMQYLAEQHFVHRDLACRNCLVGENITVKIADFGMSRDVYTCDYYRIGGSRLMPVRWMSPESISYGRFTLESDVWSFGVVLWEIYTLGKQPYFGRSNEEVIKLILHNTLLVPANDFPPAIRDLMQLCWRTEPKDRISFNQILERLRRLYNLEINSSLPRPPPFMVAASIPEDREIDIEDYMRPAPMGPPHEYIHPLPD